MKAAGKTFKKGDVAAVAEAASGGNALVTLRQCMVCKTQTPVATLSTYGARCFGCYRDYCNELQQRHAFGDPAFIDTQTQRDLALPKTNLERKAIVQSTESDDAKLQQAKRDTQQRVDAYKREHGL